MQFWANTRLDHNFERPVDDVLTQFRASRWYGIRGDIADRMALFLTDPTGPVNAICGAEDFLDLCTAALEKEAADADDVASSDALPVA